ncbi:MAG: glycoside hydrolase family 127 protein [candidate division KSB1 bacterium]|nr:glycoside hydrolase family 127 protein [candidate division KSB1 bacterium]
MRLTKLKTVPLQKVTIRDAFWSPRLESNRTVTIPAIYQRCEETGRIDAWKLNWKPGMPNEPHVFWDSDVAKWLEAACYSLITHPDPELRKTVDTLTDWIIRAQQPDGYINTHFTVVRPHMRWKNLRDWHELYCAGHLIEAAIAHRQATGDTRLLDALCRYADHIGRVFGRAPGQKRGYPGHEEIELALIRLYHVTGQERYRELAKYFVDERGRQPHYFDLEARERGEDPADYWAGSHEYTQSHLPVRQQREPVGHAVRGAYLYCAMADLAAEYQDRDLWQACQAIWKHLVRRRLYVHGGVGSSAANEGYTQDYDLPNETAYAETCAAIALFLWAHRMLQIARRGHYADVMERALYNNILAGVSLRGDTFFYENPLFSRGQHHRWTWHRCSCCPPNLARLLASLGQYIYSADREALYLQLYIGSEAQVRIAGVPVQVRTAVALPQEGRAELQLQPQKPCEFTLALRRPEWCRNMEVSINGRRAAIEPLLREGFVHLRQAWRPGDRIEIEFDMPVLRLQAHPAVRENCSRVALQRGPWLYCFEEADNGGPLHDLRLPARAHLQPRFESNLLGGVMTLTGTALRRDLDAWRDALYRHVPPELIETPIKAIPYYAWDNRAPGEMLVWVLSK